MMIRREASRNILSMASARPVLTVAGPRHAGKTTLVKTLFPRHFYANLETSETREYARADPRGFLARYSKSAYCGLIVDEYLRVPELINHINAAAMRSRRPGQFVLVTSRMPFRGAGVSRTPYVYSAVQKLLPLTISELRGAKIDMGRDEYIYRGFMPRVYGEKNADPARVYMNYLAYFVDHDVRRFTDIDTGDKNTRAAFGRLMMRLAARVGQIINLAAIAEEIGVCVPALASWIAALEANFVVFKLPCFKRRFGRRVANVPKYYFTDVGMAAFLLKIQSPEQVFRDPLAGNLFENLIIAEALKSMYNTAGGANIYYYRDINGLEIDLIVDKKSHIVPIEIKSGSEANAAYAKNLTSFKSLSPKIATGNVVYSGETKEKHGQKFVDFREVGNIVT